MQSIICFIALCFNPTLALRLSGDLNSLKNACIDLPASQLAVFSFLVDSVNDYLNYEKGLIVLGKALQKHAPEIPRYVALSSSVSNHNITGWKTCLLESLTAPHPSNFPRFKDQFQKLNLFNFKQFQRILYMDADTIAAGDLKDVFDTRLGENVHLAATRDIRGGEWQDTFNCGVMLLKPSSTLFSDIVDKLMADQIQYEYTMAEQGFLNAYFKKNWVELPVQHGANLAIYMQKRAVWDRVLPMTIIHYTMSKPWSCEKAYAEVCSIWSVYNNLSISFESIKSNAYSQQQKALLTTAYFATRSKQGDSFTSDKHYQRS